MDTFTSRRTGTTYGKSAKRLLVHDLFSDRNSQGNASILSTAQDRPVLAPSATVVQPAREAETNYTISSSRVSSSSSSSTSEVHERFSPPEVGQGKDPFDIGSSSDEQRSNGSGKRRKLTQSLRRTEHPKSRQPAPLKQTSESLPSKTSSSNAKIALTRPNKKAKATQQTEAGKSKARAETLKAQRTQIPAVLPKPTKQPPLQSKLIQSKYHEDNVPVPIGEGTNFVKNDDVDVSGHLTDRSESTVSASGTPKRKRPSTPSSEGRTSSPSQLGITLLRLNTEKKLGSRSVASSEGMNEDTEVPRRTRTRLIDRLDAPEPEKESSSEDEDVQPIPPEVSEKIPSPENARIRGRRKIDNVAQASQPSSIPTSDRSRSSQGRTTYATKARTTYAKERSHLSDMADSLDLLNPPSSQPSSQSLLHQPAISTMTSQLDMELDSDDNDDQPHVGKLKSIHELRQAGAMNRYDREFQALLEDIESTGTAMYSMRVQALTRLIKKLGDTNFLGFAASDSHFGRLAMCASPDLDSTIAVLLTIALAVLSRVNTSADLPLQLYNTVIKFAPKLLSIDCSLTQFVQEHKRDLTRSIIKDLVRLEEWILQHSILVGYTEDHIHPDQLVLGVLDSTLRQMLRLGNTDAKFSNSAYDKLLGLLNSHAKGLAHEEKNLHRISSIEKALSLLEACSMVFDSTETKVDVHKYQVLGKSLSTVMQFVRDDQVSIEQSTLRAVVSLSNKNPAMCRVLGQTPILDTVFAVISTNFATLAEHAELEQGLDEAKLDSVILALGCLLNFSECDSALRMQLADGGSERSGYLEDLVKMFNSQVSKTQEATTQEESQVLVAFGYLSMLLCTLSLEMSIRTRITQMLKDRSFEQVCVAAETFFQHLRTLESISEDDASMSAFTARFSAILEIVRKPVK